MIRPGKGLRPDVGTDAGPEEAREGVRLVDIGGRAEPCVSVGAA